MRVVPRGTVRVRNKGVSERLARGDRALRDTRDAIHPRRAFLQETMPVNRCPCRRTLNVVGNLDLDCVAPGFSS